MRSEPLQGYSVSVVSRQPPWSPATAGRPSVTVRTRESGLTREILAPGRQAVPPSPDTGMPAPRDARRGRPAGPPGGIIVTTERPRPPSSCDWHKKVKPVE